MGGEENSVSLAGMLLHHFLQRIGGLRIQTGHRLVQNPYVWIGKQHTHDDDFLPHTVGIGKNAVIECVLHLEGFRKGGDALLALLAVNLIDISHKIQVFQPL